jgi:ribosomal protein S1
MHEEAITMMDRSDEWENLKSTLPIGTRLSVTVEQHCPFGVFVTISGVRFRGLIEIISFKDDGKMTPNEYPPIGSIIDVVVLGFSNPERQVHLGAKPSQLVTV